MKRSELTVQAMLDRGFEPCENYTLEEIVKGIQFKTDKVFAHLRMTLDDSLVREETEYTMCATYKARKKREYLEMSYDNITWLRVAYRWVLASRTCVYAD